jgi:hypothetical protein
MCIGTNILDISKKHDLLTSEAIVAYGNDMSWSGKVVGKYTARLKPGTANWHGIKEVIVNHDEIEVDGLQHPGQSGSATLGQCAYVGCVHAVNAWGGVLVIPREEIVQYMIKFADKLSTLQCDNAVIKPPHSLEC